ncbi:hypothetical protein [Alkalitalea saponilacus]|uniref:WxL domain-containing protein n=1 Tax=Alkalitalea saponilacus TaxID=889453 RepID=A0A1T5E449_9BACT|nr:hypothetical protein [Alkalitalea saponilacus]ASB49109.1 hypothetical protein CDL62_08135 [Alkalitalea saponilacus]SKB78822.1 hypothetical protein SAMN03080601_01203 [Alkalitalea saponilacus]
MRKQLLTLAAIMILGLSFAPNAVAQLSDEEYNYVTMDLRGILNLTMTTNPQVDFVFRTIQEYQQGITRFNAVQLEVDATMNWDLYAYASTDNWTQVEQYSSNGSAVLPAEILEINSSVASSAPQNFNDFTSLRGLTNSEAGGGPTIETQFLAGELGTGAGESFAPGTAAANPGTHRFRLDMRLVPDIPATFPNSEVAIEDAIGADGPEFAAAGYYYLEVVYSLVEDL